MLPTLDYLYGLRRGDEHVVELDEGKTLIMGLQSISEPDERGFRTVMARLNGQMRPISVRDTRIADEIPTARRPTRRCPATCRRRSRGW